MTVNTRRREELAEAIRQSGHVFCDNHFAISSIALKYCRQSAPASSI